MSELDFSMALEKTNEEFEYSCSIAPSINPDAFAPHQILGSLSLHIKYFVDYDGLLHLKGHLIVPCRFQCDRCLGGFEKNLFLDFEEEVAPAPNDEYEFTYRMPRLKLDDVIETYLLTNFPSKILCKEDCKGLCPKCGENLNDRDCKCDTYSSNQGTRLGGRK